MLKREKYLNFSGHVRRNDAEDHNGTPRIFLTPLYDFRSAKVIEIELYPFPPFADAQLLGHKKVHKSLATQPKGTNVV